MAREEKRLEVRVNEALSLDAGSWAEVTDATGATCRGVEPPECTLFEQVLDYLSSLPLVVGDSSVSLSEEAVAAAAVCLRWGSYLAVLLDRHKPLWPAVREEGLSRIEDSEMARINIEASSALERWIDIMRSDRERYVRLVNLARHLPMTTWSVRRDREVRLLESAPPAEPVA